MGRYALAMGLSAISSSAFAEVIVVEGNKLVPTEYILTHLPEPSEDRRLSGEQIDDAVKSLFATGRFSDVSLVREGTNLKLEVVERALIDSVELEGAEAGDLPVGSLVTGTPLIAGSLEAAASAVEKMHRDKGYQDAVVRHSFEESNGRARVKLTVDAGERVAVAQVWFKGNDSFSDGTLRGVVSTKRHGFLSRIANSDLYDIDRIERDKEAIRQFYLSKGFADAHVLLTDVDRHADGFVVGFVINEGPKYSVASAELESTLQAYPGSDAPGHLVGRTFDPAAISAATGEIEQSAARAGHPFAVANSSIDRNGRGEVAVRFTLDEGSRVYIERIEISGNQKTRDFVIRRELDFAEGDPLTARRLEMARERIRRLGHFDKVDIRVRPTSVADRAVVLIDVVERKTGEFSIGGGYSTTDGPLFNVGIAQNNFAGTGRRVSASAEKGDGSSGFAVSFAEPYIFGNRISAETGLFHDQRDRSDRGSKAFREKVVGGRISLTGPITSDLAATIYYGLSNRTVSEVADRLGGSSSPAGLVGEGSSLTSSAGYKLASDRLDDRMDPTSGFYATFGQEFAGLGGDTRYLKTEASLDLYRPISERHGIVAHAGVKAGHVAGLGKALDFSDHFRASDRIVRGFETGGFGPRDRESGYHLGGTSYFSATAEIIVPTPLVPDEYGLRNVVFADMGAVMKPDTVRVSASGANPVGGNGIRASIGTGVLWDSPFGMLRADFAIPVAKQDGDREQVFGLSGGSRF